MAKMSMTAYKRKLERFMHRIPGTVKRGLTKAAKVVAKEMRSNLSGRVLQRRTGHLHGAVREEVTLQPLQARIFIAPKQQYKAQAHTKGMTITAKKGKYLVFRIGDKVVKVPSVKLPERVFAEPSLEKKRGEVIQILRRTLIAEYKHVK